MKKLLTYIYRLENVDLWVIGWVMLLDLLQLQLAQTLMNFPNLRSIQEGFDKIWLHLRSYYHYRKRQGEEQAAAHLEDFALEPSHETFRIYTQLQALQTPPKIVKYCHRLNEFINLALTSDHWPELLEKSPYAKPVSNELELQFFYELYLSIRVRFLEAQPSCEIETLISGLDQSLADKARTALTRCLTLFSEMQKQLKKTKVPSVENFKREASRHIELISSHLIKINEVAEDLDLTIGEYLGDCKIREQIGSFVLSAVQYLLPGDPLMAYLYLDELLEEEEKQKPKIREIAAPVETQPVKQQELPLPQPVPKLALEAVSPKQGPFEELKSCCQALLPYCTAFIPVGSHLENEEHQQDHLTNLLESLKALEELRTILPSQGARPAVVAMLYLKLAVALEQSAKLAVALRRLPVPFVDKGSGLLEARGRESLWKDHAPHLFVELLQLELPEEQNLLLLQMERVVSISSRYPSSGRDSLSQAIETLLQMEQFPKELQPKLQQMRSVQAQKLWQTGIETCLNIVQSVLDPSLQKVSPPEMVIPLPSIGEVASKPLNFNRLEKRLNKIQSLLLLPGNCEVARLGDESVEQRKGTIRTALRDLVLNVRLLKDSLEMAISPLITVESILLRQAVILERLLLLPLAHLPCRSRSDPSLHYLWDREGHTLRRNSHALERFVERLSEEIEAPELIERTRKLAEQLGPYLRVGYRYQTELLLPFKQLSQMRLQLLSNQLSLEQAEIIDVKPEKRLPKLEAHIQQLVESQVKQPCLAFMELANGWLDVFEKLLD